MRSHLIVLALLMSLLGLVSCGGGSDSSQSGSLQNGNVSFAVTNGSSQAFASANITTDTSNTTLYNGPFSCSIGNTCNLSIGAATNSTETYTALFYNADGDLVGAWASNSPAASSTFTRINTSATTFGAYIFKQLDQANSEEAHVSAAELEHYFSLQNASAKAQGQMASLFLNLKLHSDPFFAATGAQSLKDYLQQLQASLDKEEIYSATLSSSSSPKAIPLAAVAPPKNCSTTTSIAGKIIGAVGGGGGGQIINEAKEIVNKIPYLGPISSTISALFGGACDDTENRFQAIFDQLDELKQGLKALGAQIDNVEKSIETLTFLVASNEIYTNYGEVSKNINALEGYTVIYRNILNTRSQPYSNLAEFFAANGGLDKDSFNPSSAKYTAQSAAIKLLNDLKDQRDKLYNLSESSTYIKLKANLDTLCSIDSGIKNAQGDFIATRKVCNQIIIEAKVKVVVLQALATIMLNDELAILDSVKSVPISFSGNPFKTGEVGELSAKALQNVDLGLPDPYGLLTGASTTLLSNIAQKDVKCSKNFNGDATLRIPMISAWYPNAPEGGFFQAYCSVPGTVVQQPAYSNFYYANSTAARNVMGVLIGSDVSYSSASYKESKPWITAKSSTNRVPEDSIPGRSKPVLRTLGVINNLNFQSDLYNLTINNATQGGAYTVGAPGRDPTTFCNEALICGENNQNYVGLEPNPTYIGRYDNKVYSIRSYALLPDSSKPNSYTSTIYDADDYYVRNDVNALIAISKRNASDGRNYRWLGAYVYSLYTDKPPTSGSWTETHEQRFACLTPDCTPSTTDKASIQFKYGGPNVILITASEDSSTNPSQIYSTGQIK